MAAGDSGKSPLIAKFAGGGKKYTVGLYNFQKRFVPFILDGRKTHTIRAKRANPDVPGNTCHLYTGLRTKNARLLMRRPCVRVEDIRIWQPDPNVFEVAIAGQILTYSEREQLATRDGFDDFICMMCFWDGRLPFSGDIIHWSFKKCPSE